MQHMEQSSHGLLDAVADGEIKDVVKVSPTRDGQQSRGRCHRQGRQSVKLQHCGRETIEKAGVGEKPPGFVLDVVH